MQVNNVELIKKFRYFQDELNTGSVMRMPSTAFLVDHNPIYSGYEAPTGCSPKKKFTTINVLQSLTVLELAFSDPF